MTWRLRRLTFAATLAAAILFLPGVADANSYYGTDGQDNFTGTDSADLFWTYAGQDIVYAKDGADEIHLGADRDEANGKWGNDTIYGGDNPTTAVDWLLGDLGADDIFDEVSSDADWACPGGGGTANYANVFDGDGLDVVAGYPDGTNYSKDSGDEYDSDRHCLW